MGTNESNPAAVAAAAFSLAMLIVVGVILTLAVWTR